MLWTILKEQSATLCPFIKVYHVKGTISDKEFLEIKEVAFSKDLETMFENRHFKEGERWMLGAC